MAIYRIYWKKSAQKELKRINKSAIPQILSEIEQLSVIPFPANCKKYIGLEHTFRIRIGNYRVVYSVYDDVLTIEIIKVGHRKDIYRNL